MPSIAIARNISDHFNVDSTTRSTLTIGKRSWPRSRYRVHVFVESVQFRLNVFQNAKRVENCGIAKRQTNNRIERMNGTLRERVKVQRGWKSAKTPLAEGNRIQYNFVKPHIALEGKTPANAAGVEVRGWKDLLIMANKQQKPQI